MPELIKSAAIKGTDDIVYAGDNHAVIFREMPRESIRNAEQGFITTRGRFVDREEAWMIAEKNNQIARVTGPRGTLFSEDLYDDSSK